MNIKQTIIFLALAIGVGSMFFVPAAVSADCGGVKTSIIDCDQDGKSGKLEDSGLWGLLLLIINILTGGVGVAAVGGIVYGAITYTTAGGNMDKVKHGKEIITNTVIGLVAWALMFAFLQYLIPGGVFSTSPSPPSSSPATPGGGDGGGGGGGGAG